MLNSLIMTDEERQAWETTCFRCKKIFPREQMIGRRFNKYCRRCFWIDTALMIGVGITVWIVFVAAVVSYRMSH